jgi:hypothetical protein
MRSVNRKAKYSIRVIRSCLGFLNINFSIVPDTPASILKVRQVTEKTPEKKNRRLSTLRASTCGSATTKDENAVGGPTAPDPASDGRSHCICGTSKSAFSKDRNRQRMGAW